MEIDLKIGKFNSNLSYVFLKRYFYTLSSPLAYSLQIFQPNKHFGNPRSLNRSTIWHWIFVTIRTSDLNPSDICVEDCPLYPRSWSLDFTLSYNSVLLFLISQSFALLIPHPSLLTTKTCFQRSPGCFQMLNLSWILGTLYP